MKNKNAALIGCGRVGSTLAISLWEREYKISAIIDVNQDITQSIAQRVNCPILSTKVSDLPVGLSIIFIATPDRIIKDIVLQLLALDKEILNHCLIAHTSGAVSYTILNPLIKKGARVASIHPIQTFLQFDNEPTNLKQVYFGIEASTEAIDDAELLVKDLGGIPIRIPTEAKPLYHLACSIASNFLVTLMTMVLDILCSFEYDFEYDKELLFKMVEPLLMTTLKNIEEKTPEKALTGPISRGDIETVRAHLQSLNKYFPDYLQSYIELAVITSKVSLNENRISQIQSDRLIELLRSFRPIRN